MFIILLISVGVNQRLLKKFDESQFKLLDQISKTNKIRLELRELFDECESVYDDLEHLNNGRLDNLINCINKTRGKVYTKS